MPSEELLFTSDCTSCPFGLKNSSDAGWLSGSGLSEVTMNVRCMVVARAPYAAFAEDIAF